MKQLLTLAWISSLSALVAMIIGHFHAGRLSWLSDQISTYAAKAPLGGFVETSILLSVLSLFLLGVLVSRYGILGSSFLAHVIPFLTGAAASGLLLVARFEETAPNMSALKKAGFWAIRIQSFHDAGLLVFFYSAIVLVIALGVLIVVTGNAPRDKALGAVVACLGPLSYALMRTPWPKHLDIRGATLGINERTSLFCLWLAVVLVLAKFTVSKQGT